MNWNILIFGAMGSEDSVASARIYEDWPTHSSPVRARMSLFTIKFHPYEFIYVHLRTWRVCVCLFLVVF